LTDFWSIFTNNIIKILLGVDSNRLLMAVQGKMCAALPQKGGAVFVFHNSQFSSVELFAAGKKTFSKKLVM